jgi:hypothetical protein
MIKEKSLQTADQGNVVTKIPLPATIPAHNKASYHEGHPQPSKDVRGDGRLAGIH